MKGYHPNSDHRRPPLRTYRLWLHRSRTLIALSGCELLGVYHAMRQLAVTPDLKAKGGSHVDTRFYYSHMVSEFASYLPSAGKPEQVAESWRAPGIPLQIVAPKPVSRNQLTRAHQARCVDGILDCTIANGFGNRSSMVANSLVDTCEFMLDACQGFWAMACARVQRSGFQHAPTSPTEATRSAARASNPEESTLRPLHAVHGSMQLTCNELHLWRY
jgi:hypothetical protein